MEATLSVCQEEFQREVKAKVEAVVTKGFWGKAALIPVSYWECDEFSVALFEEFVAQNGWEIEEHEGWKNVRYNRPKGE